MEFNFIVFPSPKPSYTSETLGNRLIWIPNYKLIRKRQLKKNTAIHCYTSNNCDSRRLKRNFDSPINFINTSPKHQNYFTPQANITKRFDFSKFGENPKLEEMLKSGPKNKDEGKNERNPKLFGNENQKNGLNELENGRSSKYLKNEPKLSENNRNIFPLTTKRENAEIDDFDESREPFILCSPKNISKYQSKAFDLKNSFRKYKEIEKKEFIKKKVEKVYLDDNPVIGFIPCLLIDTEANCDKIILYFHGNGEDINLAGELCESIFFKTNIRILVIEYPGYGIYRRHNGVSSDQVLHDAENIYNYLLNVMKYDEEKIIIIGRSIGSGPASYLAANYNPGSLILISGFTSLQGVVKDLAGDWLKHLIKERFKNEENMTNVQCPTLIIHGLKDKLISYQHSVKLHDKCKAPSELILPKEMSHFEFDFDEDLSDPIKTFFIKWNLLDDDELEFDYKPFPLDVYLKPYNL